MSHSILQRTLRVVLALVSALAAVTLATPVRADQIIHLVVPYGPGAVQDTVARTFSNELSQALKTTVVVENKAGAGGTIAAAQVAKSAPDGTTLILAAASHNLAGHLYSNLGYDPLKDFVGVSQIGYSGYVIAAPASFGVNTLQDYVRAIRAKPGQYNYASAGNGSATHLGMASFLARADLQMQHIPMKSTGDAVNEVLSGRVQGVTSATIGVMGFRQDPRIKLLAFTGNKRSRFLPELPTVVESGFSGFKYDSWFGLLAPAATPRAEIDRINNAMMKILADPVVQDRLNRLGVETASAKPEEFQKVLQADWDASRQIVKASGARID